jgi:pyruvate dehydrogenase E1 component alpha subunit
MKEELDSAVRKDPIIAYQNVLKERGWIDQDAIDRMYESVKQEVDESIAFAEESPEPSPEALYEDITVAPFIPQE